jgi:anti-anti-sigma regulatory factor
MAQVFDSHYVLSLTGSLTTPRANAIHGEALAALSSHPSVAIDCSAATEMDVAFIQILVAAHRFATQSGKSVALAAPPAGLLAETLKRCGFPAPQRPTTALAEALSLSPT